MKAFYYTAIVILDCGIGGCAMGSYLYFDFTKFVEPSLYCGDGGG
jgi:hypothetical protein